MHFLHVCDSTLSHDHSTGDNGCRFSRVQMPRHCQCCWCTMRMRPIRRPESGKTSDAFSDCRLRDTIMRQGTCTAWERFSLVLVMVDGSFDGNYDTQFLIYRRSSHPLTADDIDHFTNLLYIIAVCWCEYDSGGWSAMFDLLTIVYISDIFSTATRDIFHSLLCIVHSEMLP